MKLVSYVLDDAPGAGLVDGDRVLPLVHDERPLTLREVLERGWLEHAQQLVDRRRTIGLAELTFAPPIPDPGAIWCAALTFATHVQEDPGRTAPEHPLFFLRGSDSHVGHRQPILRPAVSDQLDYEGELAAIIGRPARHVSLDDAHTYVAGYSCYNDGSVRDWQRHSSQITLGKNFERSGAFGPWVVTPEEFGDPYRHTITTRVNGDLRQHESVDALLFRIEYLIHYLSAVHTLRPGDVVVCGTPGGVGVRRAPPTFLEPGDVVVVEIDGIGALENRVEKERPEHPVTWRRASAAETMA